MINEKKFHSIELLNYILVRYLTHEINTFNNIRGPSKSRINVCRIYASSYQTKKIKSDEIKLLNDLYPHISPYPFFRNSFKMGLFFVKTEKLSVPMKSLLPAVLHLKYYTSDRC